VVEDTNFFDKHPELLKDIYSKVFTPEEIELIDAYELEMDSLVSPIKSNDEIIKIFNDFPINLEATDANGVPVFKYKDELYEEVTKLGHRLLAEKSPEKSLPEHSTAEEVFEESPVVETKEGTTSSSGEDW